MKKYFFIYFKMTYFVLFKDKYTNCLLTKI